MKLGGDNCDTQWVCDNKVIYINKLVIKGGPGNYDVKYTPSIGQRLASLFGLGPSKTQIESIVRSQVLGEPLSIREEPK